MKNMHADAIFNLHFSTSVNFSVYEIKAAGRVMICRLNNINHRCNGENYLCRNHTQSQVYYLDCVECGHINLMYLRCTESQLYNLRLFFCLLYKGEMWVYEKESKIFS